MTKEKETKNKPILKIVITILSVIALLSSAFAIYELLMLVSIEDMLRYIVIGILIILDLLIILKTRGIWKKRPKKKRSKRIGYIIFMVVLFVWLLVL